jgi:hypothetical protein
MKNPNELFETILLRITVWAEMPLPPIVLARSDHGGGIIGHPDPKSPAPLARKKSCVNTYLLSFAGRCVKIV